MAIAFTNDRYFRTDRGSTIFQNVPTASLWFKILVTSADPPNIPGEISFLSKELYYNFFHEFLPTATTGTVLTRYHLTGGASQNCSIDIALNIGVIYGIAVTWDGVAGRQMIYVNGIPTQFSGGTIAGNTTNFSVALQLGIQATPPTHVVYQLEDHNIWNNYILTQADVLSLVNGCDPTTIGTGATWRGRWTMAGTTGAHPVPGDAGLKNSYGGGGTIASGGDGSDVISVAGSGSAVYVPTLVWTPTVTATPYVATSGKVVVFYPFTSTIDGSQTTPSSVNSIPTLTVNGTNLGPLEKPWFPGYQPFLFYTTPGSQQIQPSDNVVINAPSAWCNTPAGSVAGFSNQAVANRSGKSSFGSDTNPKTMSLGIGMNQRPMLWDLSWYQPFLNWNFLLCWPPGNRGKFTQNATVPILDNASDNLIDNTRYPGMPGLWLVMWDVNNTASPTNCWLSNGDASTTCTERVDLRQRPTSGIGYASVFDVENVPGNTVGTGGSYVASTYIQFNINDPSGNPSTNYSNLWVVAPGDWDLVDGVPVVDRSDRFALSRRYLDRMPLNVANIRWLASGPVDGNPSSLPYPEFLQSATDENFGYLNNTTRNIGVSSFGPVDLVATPYIYSPFLGRPGAKGQTFTATLAAPITTAPAVGTYETWTISDGATAPLMAGLEMQIDSEIVRIISGSGTSWVVYRGSNGTTPATHSTSTLTVFGRIAITTVLNSSGLIPNRIVTGITTSVPHGVTTGNGFGTMQGAPTLTFTSGETGQWIDWQVYVTGPNTLFENAQNSTSPSGAKPNRVYTTNPASTLAQLEWPLSASIPHEVQATLTSKIAGANYWCNLWFDACDDLVYEIARRVLANFPAGRKVYVEAGNEPWNFGFSSFYYMTLMGPIVLPSFSFTSIYYVDRALKIHDIFRRVFGAAGRADEIVGILNSQFGSGDAAQYLNYAQSINASPVGAIAIAPYWGIESTTLNGTYSNTIDDEQLIDMGMHDLWYNPRINTVQAQAAKSAIAAYNTATGNNCILTAYESGLAGFTPYSVGMTHQYERNHDCNYNPNAYIAEWDYYAWMQSLGFNAPLLSSFSEFWGANSGAWQLYHSPCQDHGKGDGSDGKLNNLLCRANPTATHYKGASVNQDANTVAVRGQAWLDWMAAVAGIPPAAANAYALTVPTPASGLINTTSGNFTVQPNGVYTGTITITPSGGGLSAPIVLTWSNSSVAQTFAITPTSPSNVTLTPTNSGSLTNPGPVTYAMTSATAYTFTAPSPSSGVVGVASSLFTVQPNGPYTGTITVTPTGGGLTAPIVLTWSNSSTTQTFSIVPTLASTVTLTPTNSGGLTDQGILTYTVTAPPPGTARTPWLGSWFSRWFAAGPSVSSGSSNSTSAAGGVRHGGGSAVSFLDVDAPRLRHRFVPWPRRGYRPSGR